MNRRARIALFVMLTLFINGGLANIPSARAAGICDSTTVDDAHFSSGTGGIIAKVRYRCGPNDMQLRVSHFLYKCFTKSISNCATITSETFDLFVPGGTTKTVVIPLSASAAGKGKGYWYAKTALCLKANCSFTQNSKKSPHFNYCDTSRIGTTKSVCDGPSGSTG